MNSILFSPLPTWAILVRPEASLAASLGTGIGLGWLYFHGLWWRVRRLAGGGRVVPCLCLLLGNWLLLAGMLALASRQGAAFLLVMTLGVLSARAAVMRRLQTAP